MRFGGKIESLKTYTSRRMSKHISYEDAMRLMDNYSYALLIEKFRETSVKAMIDEMDEELERAYVFTTLE